MIEKAKAKGGYKEIHKGLLCKPEEFKSERSDWIDQFDFVTASGLLADGHATNEIFDEMLMALKTGGYAIFTSRVEYMDSLNYQQGIDERVEAGKWELVTKDTFEKYSNAPKEAVGRFKPVDVNLLVFKKL